MKHPHYEVIMEWAADTSKVVQIYDSFADKWNDFVDETPSWSPSSKYRIKPTPKPDVVKNYCFRQSIFVFCDSRVGANLEVTFDGETGKLKKAEVLE